MFGISLELLRHREQSDIPILLRNIIDRIKTFHIDYSYRLNEEEYKQVDLIITQLKQGIPVEFNEMNASILINVLRKFIELIPEESLLEESSFHQIILSLIRLTRNLMVTSQDTVMNYFYSMYPSKYWYHLNKIYTEIETQINLLEITPTKFHFPKQLKELRFTTTNKKGIKILSLDGGGMRGIFSLKILELIITRIYGNADAPGTQAFLKQFDLIIGTSTGSIIASALIKGYSITTIKQMFYSLGDQIFTAGYLQTPWNYLKLLKSGDFYSHTNLSKYLYQNLGNEDISECTKKLIIVAAESINTEFRPYLFKSYDTSSTYQYNSQIGISDAIRASTAAPTYFQSYSDRGHVILDGGLVANNPTEIAIFEAYDAFPDQSIDLILSIGTGKLKKIGAGNPPGPRMLINQFINMVTDSEIIHIRVLEWIKDYAKTTEYFRFSPEDLGSIDLDNSDKNILINGESQTEEYMSRHEDRVNNLNKMINK